MRNLLFFISIALILFAAENPNQLTKAEIAEGWILLYDGESAFGWSPEGGAEWSTDPDGSLSAKSGDSGDMLSSTTFGEYQLSCEMRAPSAKGSGLVVNGNLLPPPKAGDKWHTYTATLAGGHLLANLDGKKVLDVAAAQPGTVALHFRKGDHFSIRQLKLKPLGLKPLFNGKDLSGWNVIPRENAKVPAEWSVKDAAIHVVHGAGQLETETQYKDFVLQLEVRTNSDNPRLHPNSGVFLRGEPKGFWSGYEAQIRNEFKDEDRNQPVDFGTGAIYHHQPARRVISNDNEYFVKTIIARGRHFAIWVNGIQVTDWDDPHPEGVAVKDKQARLGAGTISLQAHDPTTNLDFRNIRIAELK